MSRRPPVAALLLALAVEPAVAAEIHGSGDVGLWALFNNVSSAPGFLADDGYQASYVTDRYQLLNVGLRLEASDLTSARESRQRLHARFQGRMLLHLEGTGYAFGFSERARHDLQELHVELERIAGSGLDLRAGRQRIFEAGGLRFDGARGLYHFTEEFAAGLYAGLGADPRTLTGYIGPAYRPNPFTLDFQLGGAYAAYRGPSFRLDAAASALLYKGSLDRLNLFAQGHYTLTPAWALSALLDADAAGEAGIPHLQANVIVRPAERVTNTLTFDMFRPVVFGASDASGVAAPAGVDPAPIGGSPAEVSTDPYYVGRAHTMVRIFKRNYLFGAFEYARRTFDAKNRFKYTAGYRDPRWFGTPTELRLQLDLVDNFRGFHTLFDASLAREFRDGRYRVELGGTYYGNERDIYLGNRPSGARQTEKEYALSAGGSYQPYPRVSLLLNYALHIENDLADNGRGVALHELYAGSHFRF